MAMAGHSPTDNDVRLALIYQAGSVLKWAVAALLLWKLAAIVSDTMVKLGDDSYKSSWERVITFLIGAGPTTAVGYLVFRWARRHFRKRLGRTAALEQMIDPARTSSDQEIVIIPKPPPQPPAERTSS